MSGFELAYALVLGAVSIAVIAVAVKRLGWML